MSKKDLILKYLQDGNHITQREAAEKFHSWRLADVVFKLKKEGYPIHTIERNSNGTRYAEYVMLTGQTEKCPWCGAFYDLALADKFTGEGIYGEIFHYHTCPCCGNEIDDYEEEPEYDEDDIIISETNRDILHDYLKEAVR